MFVLNTQNDSQNIIDLNQFLIIETLQLMNATPKKKKN
jgi:hypothetical protein